MRKTFLILSTIFIFSAAASAETTGRGGLYFGAKSLSGDWGDLDTQPAWGINLDVKDVKWPVWITMGYLKSQDEETVVTSLSPFATTDIVGKTQEFQLGVKKDFFPVNRIRISIAGGPDYIHASLQRPVAPYNTDSDSSIGLFAGGDVTLSLGYLILGVGYRYSHANVDLLGKSIDAGGQNLAFSIGFGW